MLRYQALQWPRHRIRRPATLLQLAPNRQLEPQADFPRRPCRAFSLGTCRYIYALWLEDDLGSTGLANSAKIFIGPCQRFAPARDECGGDRHWIACRKGVFQAFAKLLFQRSKIFGPAGCSTCAHCDCSSEAIQATERHMVPIIVCRRRLSFRRDIAD